MVYDWQTIAQPVRLPKTKLIPAMKATKLLLATALFAGLATLSIAGPGPQFWAQQTKNAQARQTKTGAQTQVAPEAAKATKVCATCHCPAMRNS